MREGDVDRKTAERLMARRMSALSPEERADFEANALYIIPTWKRTIPVTKRYLIGLGNPVARVDITSEFGPPSVQDTFHESEPNPVFAG
jgi:hypothetical protein